MNHFIFIIFSLITLVFCILLILITYLARKEFKKKISKIKIDNVSKIDVVIPVANEQDNILKCLESLIQQQGNIIANIFVVISNSHDSTKEIVKNFTVKHTKTKLILDMNNKGKIGALVTGLNLSNKKDVLLLDADMILDQKCVLSLLSYHQQNNSNFTTCLIDAKSESNLINHFSSYGRVFRQYVLRPMRNACAVSNVPGNLILVNRLTYLDMLNNNGISDDLSTTFRLIANGHQVDVVYENLAWESERNTIRSLFLQRVRWAIGFIDSWKFFTNACKRVNTRKELYLFTYPIFWYLIYFFMSLLVLLSFFSIGYLGLFSVLSVIYGIVIIYSNQYRIDKNINYFALISHACVYHFIITFSFVKGLYIYLTRGKADLYHVKNTYDKN